MPVDLPVRYLLALEQHNSLARSYRDLKYDLGNKRNASPPGFLYGIPIFNLLLETAIASPILQTLIT